MPRIALSLSSAALLLAATLASAQAQTTAVANLQTVASPSGYQYQVPADWQQIPNFVQQRMGSQTVSTDGEVSSTDGNEHAKVDALEGFGITTADLPTMVASYFAPPPGAPSDMPAMNVVAQPSSVQVSGADAAENAAASYADPNGNQRVVDVRIAIAGQKVYIFTVDVPQSFYQSDPAFGQIMNSFTLTPSLSAASG